jgi:hypothetical protein
MHHAKPFIIRLSERRLNERKSCGCRCGNCERRFDHDATPIQR